MAVNKYMKRIIQGADANLEGLDDDDRMRSATMEALHDHTYGISSDTLVQFTCVLAALIHDGQWAAL